MHTKNYVDPHRESVTIAIERPERFSYVLRSESLRTTSLLRHFNFTVLDNRKLPRIFGRLKHAHIDDTAVLIGHAGLVLDKINFDFLDLFCVQRL